MRNKYPYTDFHELNADWLLTTVKEAADEAGSMNDRVTTLESDVAPIKAAMPGLASDVSDLKVGVGQLEDKIHDDIEPAVTTLQDEVETPTTGLLDRVTALENTPAGQSDAVLYLEFDSSLVAVDPSTAWDSRITYDFLDDFVPLNTSGDGLKDIKLYDINSQRVFLLNQYHRQESVTPNGGFTFTCRVPNYSGGQLVNYTNYNVVVAQSAQYPSYTTTVEIPLPEVSSADSGSFLAVDENGEWGLDQPAGGLGSLESSATFIAQGCNGKCYYVKNGYTVTVTVCFTCNFNGVSGDLIEIPYLPAISSGIYNSHIEFSNASGNSLIAGLARNGNTGAIIKLFTSTTAGQNYSATFSYVTPR